MKDSFNFRINFVIDYDKKNIYYIDTWARFKFESNTNPQERKEIQRGSMYWNMAVGIWQAYFNKDFMSESDKMRRKREAEAAKETQFNSLVAQGDHFYTAKNYVEAIKAYKKAGELNPNRIDEFFNALIKNGDDLNAQGNYPAAFDYYKKAATMNYHDKNIIEKLSALFGSSGNIDDEENFCKSLTEINPEDVVAHVFLGTLYLTLNEDDKALISLQKAASLAPEEPKTLILLGAAYLKSKRYDEAIEYFNDTLKLAPKDLTAHYLLGITYEQKNDYKTAKKYFKQVLKISPNNSEIKEALKRISKSK